MNIPALSDILAAATRINPYVRRTPVLCSAAIDHASGASLWFKCENLQHIGAFKYRGASNAVWSMDEAEAIRGVLTHSSGNHGAALGLAASQRGIPAHIVVPENAPAIKVANMRETGAQLHFCTPNLDARERGAAEIQARTGAQMVHPFSDPLVIAGQGTAVVEFLEQVDELDCVVVPVGGGGLLSGTAIAVAATRPDIDVIAAEPEGAADAWRAMQSGKREIAPAADTICDGLRTGIGDINFRIMQKTGVKVETASDEETLLAMRLIWDRLKLIVEPSAAVCLAVVLKHRARFQGHRVGIILSGGNVDLDRLPWG